MGGGRMVSCRRQAMMQVQGRERRWNVPVRIDDRMIRDLRDDGVRVDEIVHSVPRWAIERKLTGLWCFLEDVIRLRWPFR